MADLKLRTDLDFVKKAYLIDRRVFSFLDEDFIKLYPYFRAIKFHDDVYYNPYIPEDDPNPSFYYDDDDFIIFNDDDGNNNFIDDDDLPF
jgi:hypothetical protein